MRMDVRGDAYDPTQLLKFRIGVVSLKRSPAVRREHEPPRRLTQKAEEMLRS